MNDRQSHSRGGPRRNSGGSGSPRGGSGSPRGGSGSPQGGSRPARGKSSSSASDRYRGGSKGHAKGSSYNRPDRRSGGQSTNRSRGPVTNPPVDVHQHDGVRLQKVLAAAGHGSRRACEKLIAQGRVQVDGHTVTELGTRINPDEAVIHVDGLRVSFDDSLVTIALNKPVGVHCTMNDDRGRPDLSEFVADFSERLFHVGRLDVETDGLLLLTNDGELANRLMHPSYEVPKTYVATVEGRPRRSLAQELEKGIELEDGPVKVDKFTVIDTTPHTAIVELTLHEGRNHIVRRLLEEVGLPVTTLTRTQLGTIRLGHIKLGRTRVIEGRELAQLMASVGM